MCLPVGDSEAVVPVLLSAVDWLACEAGGRETNSRVEACHDEVWIGT